VTERGKVLRLIAVVFAVAAIIGLSSHGSTTPQQTSALAQAQADQDLTMNGQLILKIDGKISDISSDVSPFHIDLAVRMIRVQGWKCDGLSAVVPFAMHPGFHVWCNQYRYGYEMADRGGHWRVTIGD